MAWKWLSWQRLTFEREKALAEAEQKWERREEPSLGVGVSAQAAGRGHVAGTDSECSSDVV